MIRHINYVAFFLFLFLLLAIESFIPAELVFIIKTVYLLLYLSFEILNYRKINTQNWLINPAVLASGFTFILGFGITNLIFFLPEEITSNFLYNKLGPEPFQAMSNVITSVILGAIAMWLGFKSKWGIKLFNIITIKLFIIRKFLKRSFQVNYNFIFFIIIISIVGRLYAIDIGIYGYAQSEENVAAAAGFSQFLFYLGILSSLAIAAVSLSYFSKPNTQLKYFLIVIISVEIFFGLLSGMKSEMVYPIVIPILTYLIIRKKFHKSLIILAIVVLIIAYSIIEPFRILKNLDRFFKSDPVYIINTMAYAFELNKKRGVVEKWSTDPVYMQILKRNNYVMDAARAIEFKDTRGLTGKDPDFIGRLITVPIQAYIPRAIWSSKPIDNLGSWFTRIVWGYNLRSATAMTPFGFLYFAGGNIAIIIIFFLFGIMQRTLFQFINLGAGGILIFVGLLGTVVLIDSNVNSIFVSWLRNYPFLLIVQYFIFKK